MLWVLPPKAAPFLQSMAVLLRRPRCLGSPHKPTATALCAVCTDQPGAGAVDRGATGIGVAAICPVYSQQDPRAPHVLGFSLRLCTCRSQTSCCGSFSLNSSIFIFLATFSLVSCFEVCRLVSKYIRIAQIALSLILSLLLI